jgi:hypothetical protein
MAALESRRAAVPTCRCRTCCSCSATIWWTSLRWRGVRCRRLDDLDAEDFSFAPLLPGDDAALAAGWIARRVVRWLSRRLRRRARAARHGSLDDCAGGSPRDRPRPGRHRSGRSGIGSGSAENDLVELEEFVKVGVLLIRSTLADEANDSAG